MENIFDEEKNKYFLHPGYVFVSEEPYLIHTVLGSCVSIAVWDRNKKFGGMNHFVLPEADAKPNGRYGNVSIPYLFHMMQNIHSEKKHWDIHLLGGASNVSMKSAVGSLNVDFALNWLEKNHYAISSRDLGGSLGRKVIFNTETGELLVYKIKKIRESDWYSDEK
ncbi:MAG TPA: chemotaxis protein CheD [Thermotogota bacterium]|nr:chemotaxis protein CheD [Thermotogota bacterium]HPJ87557.1 chemotaxis protein CheD [Thermotogota bacterium]HPR94762.1 chemotaxis protein CheD [Thermotogota bacterium]